MAQRRRLRFAVAGHAFVTFVAFVASSPGRTAFAKDAVTPPATDVYIAGVSTALTRARGGDRDLELTAVGLWTSHVGFGFERPISIRVINSASLAGGSHGVQGGLGTAVAGGPRLSLGKNHGLFARGGIDAFFFGNQYLWDSSIELPQAQAGYQWLVPKAVVDVALKGGLILVGRHNTGDSGMRALDQSFEWGAIGSVHLGPMDINVSYTHLQGRGGGKPIELFEGALCGLARPFAVCTQLRYGVGDELFPDLSARFTRLTFAGMTVGILIPDKLSDLKL